MYYGPEEALYEGFSHTSLGTAETELYCVDVQQETYPEEANFVADHIRKLLQSGMVREGEGLRPVRPEDIVILLRSPGSSGIYYQRALEQAGIRYTTGGGIDLLKTDEIATFHAILQVIHNPRLDIPLVAALSSPAFGFTADDLAALRAKRISCSFYDALLQDDSEKTRQFLKTLQHLRNAVRHFSLTKLMEEVLVATSLEEIYGAMEGSQLRLANLQTFFQLASDFESGGNHDLGRFLEHLEVMADKGLITAGEQGATGCVSIMSIHKSKGLEFPVVYLCGLGREFNMENQRENVLCHKSMGLGLSAVDAHNRLRYPTIAKRAIAVRIGQESVSEELRVLYVAMTRARDRLIMTYASKRLQKDLADIVQRMDMGGEQLLIREAVCPGEWVLLTALQKTEAGELFALAGKPRNTQSGPYPWKIRVATAPQPVVDNVPQEKTEHISPDLYDKIQKGLSFHYLFAAATSTPSKQTATGLKGRWIDQEAAEDTIVPQTIYRNWRQPTFVSQSKQGKDYGNALHTAMQYIDYTACIHEEAVRAELKRLTDQGYLSAQQAELVDESKIACFFATALGQQLQGGNVVREFKFSLLMPADAHGEGLEAEQILLQGVVDCALLEDDGITIIDFKTDHVTEDSLPHKLAQYAPQVQIYAQAMQRIYQKPIKQRLLYFFSIGRFVCV
jgi:ATP-dependent helicase/nuclease subunit A